MRALVLDMTHGGDIIAQELLRRGWDVVCVDVYGTAPEEAKRAVAASGGTAARSAPPGGYDVLIAPAHCPDSLAEGARWSERMTFHQAVGTLIEDKRFRIEITGVKGKTSACYLLARILDAAGRKALLHTSRGQGPYAGGGHVIQRRMSIAPTSLLRLPDGDYDVIVAECSLGGSGRADMAAITNLAEDYPIAAGTRKASEAKASILCDGANFVREDELGLWSRHGRPLRGYGGRVSVVGRPRLGEPLPISFRYMGQDTETLLAPAYLQLQYLDAIELALAMSEALDVPTAAVLSALRSFNGVPGRGEVALGDPIVVRDRNPGVSHMSARMTLESLKAMNALDDAVIMLTPASRKVCEKLEPERVAAVAAEFGVPVVLCRDGPMPVPDGARLVIELIKEGFQ